MTFEIRKICQVDSLNCSENNGTNLQMNNKEKFGNLAFGLLMTLSNNMIDFGISPKEAYEIIEPKITIKNWQY